MPRENRRSFGYRFVTCDDPSGVVECGSIRRSRAKYENMEAGVENPRKAKSQVRPPREAEIGRCLGVDGGLAVVQLSEVSRGAHKLNRMIKTWSRGASFDGQSKNIAKNLLKGALDLQESLILLGKLQDATKYVAQLKQKAEISEDLQKDARLKQRISVDEAPGMYKFRRKEFDSICDMPSTSSSQSSMINGDDAAYYAESAAFSTPITQKGSVCRSNVIAKLMGLEEIPLKKRPTLNTDVDKFSKPRFDVPRLGREPRSLKEILEGMQSKGLLRSDSVGNWKCRNDDLPPIVLIKPFADSVVKENEHLVQEERILRTEVMLKNGKMKEEISRKFSDGQEKVDRSASKEVEEYESFRRQSKRSDRMKGGSHSKKQLPAQISKKSPKSNAVDRKPGEVQKVRKNSGRYSEEASRSRKPFPDPQFQDYREPTVTRLVRTEYHGPNKMKIDTSAPQSRTQMNVPNRRILEGHQTKSRDHSRSLKMRQITVARQKDIRQNEIVAVENVPNRRILEGHQTKSRDHSKSLKMRQITVARQKDIRQNEIVAVEWEKLEEENNVSRRIEVDPVTTETSSSTLTSSVVEETDQAATLFQLLEDSKNNQGDIDLEEHHVILLGRDHNRAFTTRHDEKALLWSDSTFLAHLENLFKSFGIYPIILKSNDKNQPRSVLEKLYLDCASELIEWKSLQAPLILHPVTLASRGTGSYLTSVDKLIEEVCDGINDLNGWCEFADGHLSADGFNTLLKRDMWCKRIVTGTWELGWKDGFSRKDFEHVVIHMEKMVLCWLIEEAIAEV